MHKFGGIMKSIEELEQQEMQTFYELHPYASETNNLEDINSFLYHGIRYQKHLEILENIFKERMILAGKHIPEFPTYRLSDNCNDGEYISLLEYKFPNYQAQWDTFIKPNVTLVISPECDAKKTIYVPTHQWDDIKQNYPQTKNRYSYMEGEYQVKDFIPLSMVVAIGIPFQYLIDKISLEDANKLLEDTINLMETYEVYKPIIDTSFLNLPITNVEDPITLSNGIINKKELNISYEPDPELFKTNTPSLNPKCIKNKKPRFKVYIK